MKHISTGTLEISRWVLSWRSPKVAGLLAQTSCLIWPHKKKPNGVRSHERGGHSTGSFLEITRSPVIPERGSWQPPPCSHVGAHTIKRAVSVCPHCLASIPRFRLLSQDRKLCFCRLRVKVARSRRQI